MKTILRIAASAIVVAVLGASAANAAVTVSAQDDIFLAGQSTVPVVGYPTAGDTSDLWGSNPSAPPNSQGNGAGLLPVAENVFAGEVLHITATGTVSCCYGGSPTNGPNGGGLGGTANINGYGNVASFTGNELGLDGVFNAPSGPWSIFEIGAADTIIVPVGATKLYLGTVDAYGFQGNPGWYNDNTGAFQVSGIPEPATWAMLLLGFFGIGFMVRGSRRQDAIAIA